MGDLLKYDRRGCESPSGYGALNFASISLFTIYIVEHNQIYAFSLHTQQPAAASL